MTDRPYRQRLVAVDRDRCATLVETHQDLVAPLDAVQVPTGSR